MSLLEPYTGSKNSISIEMFNSGFDADFKKNGKITPSEPVPVEKTPANSFRKLFKNFASDTSFGGISKATLSEGHIRRFIWFLISATCYGFTIYMCYLLIKTYTEKPIKTSVDISYEKNIDFPSVTVCNLNQFRVSKVKNITAINSILRDYSNAKRNRSDGSSFESSVTAQKDSFKEQFSNDIRDNGKSVDDNDIDLDEKKIIEELVAIAAAAEDREKLINASHQFDDMILSCSWRGFDCLAGYFEAFWVQTWNWKFGNCFTFNPGVDKVGNSLQIFRTSKPGANYGLTLDINIEQEEYVPELTDEAGVNVIVHNARQMPFPYDEGITVPPGYSSSIALRKESIVRVDPFNNGSCHSASTLSATNIYRSYLNGGANKYSVKACLESCLAAAQFSKCKCSDAKYAGYIGSLCHESNDLSCMNNVSSDFKNNKLGCDEKCPQPCEHHSYRYSIMTSTLTTQAKATKEKDKFAHKKGPSFDFDDNFLRVKIFYDELNLQKVVQSTYYDLQTLISDLGGQFGLWIGISMISFAEFGELLISLCIVATRKSRDKKKTKNSDLEMR